MSLQPTDPATTALLRGYRQESWYVLAFDRNGVPLGEFDGCQSLNADWTSARPVRGTGSLSWEGESAPDWLNLLLQPWYRATFADGSYVEWPLGLFIPATPEESWEDGTLSQDVDIYDRLLVLVEDEIDTTYVLPAGAITTEEIRIILNDGGIADKDISLADSSATLANSMVWEPGTTRLQMVNDLLASLNYFSLWADGYGTFHGDPYVAPQDRPVALVLEDAPDGIYDPKFSHLRDGFKVPNKYVGVSRGSGETEALISVATNTDPASPFSQPSRGRWITESDSGIEATDQATLDAIVARRLAEATQVASDVSLSIWTMPLAVNDIVTFGNSDADVDFRATVQSTKIELQTDGTADMEINIREVLS